MERSAEARWLEGEFDDPRSPLYRGDDPQPCTCWSCMGGLGSCPREDDSDSADF